VDIKRKRTEVKVNSLTISDYDQIVALWQKAGLPFRPQGRDRKEAIQAQMEADPDFFIGAFEDNRLVGIVVASTDGRRGWINRLAVDPQFRRRQVAKTLVAEAEKILRGHGVRIFCALVDDGNIGSLELFKSCGYREHRDIVYFSKRESEQV
jgi:ribosomal protein S18 acetylase RimI-like enzyme